MNVTIAGWSLAGTAATVLIVAGIVLLVAWAFRRGLHHGALDGTDADLASVGGRPGDPGGPAGPRKARDSSRTMGAAGAAMLVVGLALGAIAATGGWGTGQAAGPGTPPQDCAQAWSGCPQATVAP